MAEWEQSGWELENHTWNEQYNTFTCHSYVMLQYQLKSNLWMQKQKSFCQEANEIARLRINDLVNDEKEGPFND